MSDNNAVRCTKCRLRTLDRHKPDTRSHQSNSSHNCNKAPVGNRPGHKREVPEFRYRYQQIRAHLLEHSCPSCQLHCQPPTVSLLRISQTVSWLSTSVS